MELISLATNYLARARYVDFETNLKVLDLS